MNSVTRPATPLIWTRWQMKKDEKEKKEEEKEREKEAYARNDGYDEFFYQHKLA